MDCMSDGENSLLFTLPAFATQNFPSADVVLPRERSRVFKQFVKGLRVKTSHFYEDPLRRPQPYVGAADRLIIADKGHSAILHLRHIVSQIRDLLFQDRLQTEMAGRDQFVSLHYILIFSD